MKAATAVFSGNLTERLRLQTALTHWRYVSMKQRHAFYIRECFTTEQKDAYYDFIIEKHDWQVHN